MLNIELVQRVKTVPCWNIWRICFQIEHKRRTLCQNADWILTNWINNILHKHDVSSIWDHTKYLHWSKAISIVNVEWCSDGLTIIYHSIFHLTNFSSSKISLQLTLFDMIQISFVSEPEWNFFKSFCWWKVNHKFKMMNCNFIHPS